MLFRYTFIFVLIFSTCYYKIIIAARPNIIFILADDLGWNDVGFHGSNSISTPNIDALAYSGIILNNYYVQPMCTPTRSALLTGKYPIHLGMQHHVIKADEPRGLPLNETLMPQYLQNLGYVSHLVGKWHLGHYKKEYTPTYRGFQSHLGCWSGYIDYNDHTFIKSSRWGIDMHRNMETAFDLHGQYLTDLYTDEAIKVISNHNTTNPLFLFIAHNAPHFGNDYNPNPVPEKVLSRFRNIKNDSRKHYAGMVYKLDESIGNITKALYDRKILDNSIIIFSSDNGGAVMGMNNSAASNWPLRGVKNSFWEGGVKASGAIWSPLLNKQKRVSKQLMHVTDWLPTLYSAAGGDTRDLKNIDGINMWNILSNNEPSKRDFLLININEINNNSALIYRNWKIVRGSNAPKMDSWYGPSERNFNYKPNKVSNSLIGKIFSSLKYKLTSKEILKARNNSILVCPYVSSIPCKSEEATCLFNIENDPCERQNLAKFYPNKIFELEKKLYKINETVVPAGNKPSLERADPKYFNYVWTNFGDYLNLD